MKLKRNAPLYTAWLPDHVRFNKAILDGFLRHRDDPDNRRSHFFLGRFENVYMNADKIPALAQVLGAAVRGAAEVLGRRSESLRCGFWFNQMLPGEVTLAHCHDEDDELMSGVYYVSTPPGSGSLIISDGPFQTHVKASAGMFVFFPPDLVHEVRRNESSLPRLSIGLNFGPALSQQGHLPAP